MLIQNFKKKKRNNQILWFIPTIAALRGLRKTTQPQTRPGYRVKSWEGKGKIKPKHLLDTSPVSTGRRKRRGRGGRGELSLLVRATLLALSQPTVE